LKLLFAPARRYRGLGDHDATALRQTPISTALLSLFFRSPHGSNASAMRPRAITAPAGLRWAKINDPPQMSWPHPRRRAGENNRKTQIDHKAPLLFLRSSKMKSHSRPPRCRRRCRPCAHCHREHGARKTRTRGSPTRAQRNLEAEVSLPENRKDQQPNHHARWRMSCDANSRKRSTQGSQRNLRQAAQSGAIETLYNRQHLRLWLIAPDTYQATSGRFSG
jgi:hypothetical protein